jgi:hypothetical protein
VIRRVRIEVNFNGLKIALPKGVDMPLQLDKKFLCPIDPLKGAIEWVDRHGKVPV